MLRRYRNYDSLLSAVTLGTGLTALFLLVRCSVPERDYSRLGIGDNAGSGGLSGAAGDGSGGTGAGHGGLGGTAGGSGGQSGSGGQPGEPVVPIPCDSGVKDAGVIDAGVTDAGVADAGTDDAGAGNDAACECVDGFLQAVDADGDGEGSRACTLVPGLECDDGDPGVTHNGCGGCSALPSAIGDACLDCGAYACDGPDALACRSLPGPVEDPDCRCVDGLITARDTDGDGQGTRLCEANPGTDCNDGDDAFVTNACGGCESLPGTVGAACNECGVYACSGTALACVPSTGSAGQQCLNTTVRQTCIGTGFWGGNVTCANVCYQGNCELCTPGTFQCVDIGGGSTQVQICGNVGGSSSSSTTIGWGSYDSCLPGETCNPANGACTGQLLLPRDETFDVAPRGSGLPWHELLNTALDSDYG